jgi:hypothetical protein
LTYRVLVKPHFSDEWRTCMVGWRRFGELAAEKICLTYRGSGSTTSDKATTGKELLLFVCTVGAIGHSQAVAPGCSISLAACSACAAFYSWGISTDGDFVSGGFGNGTIRSSVPVARLQSDSVDCKASRWVTPIAASGGCNFRSEYGLKITRETYRCSVMGYNALLLPPFLPTAV